MADYTETAPAPAAALPLDATESSFDSSEPLVTPEEVREGFLMGLPLTSPFMDPVTRLAFQVTNPMIKRFIHRAVGLAELETQLTIFPTQFMERHPHDRPASEAYGYFLLDQRPAVSVEELAVVSTDGQAVYKIPTNWVERGYLHRGRVHVVPFAIQQTVGAVSLVGLQGPGLLPAGARAPWVPAFWTITYTAGFPEGKLPIQVNELIGTIAAMEILVLLAAMRAQVSSSSLSIDGLSTSTSGPGPQLYDVLIGNLETKRKWLVARLKRKYGLGVMVSNV